MAGGLDLREMTSSLAEHEVASLCDDDLTSTVLEAVEHLNAASAHLATVMEEFERRGRWAEDGARSAAAWAAARTGSRTSELKASTRAGKALKVLPSAAEPARSGRLSPAHLGVLATCVRGHPDLAARDEELLVAQACELDADAFRVAGRYWCALAADAATSEPAPQPDPVSELHLSQTLDGWWVLNALLSPQDGAIVDAAIQAGVDRQLRAQRDGDPSVALVASQLAAQALVDLAAQEHRCEPAKPTVPDRYRVGLIARPDEVDDLLAEEACDATFYRIVFGADGEPLDVGRDTRRWPNGIRRAITARDGGCVFPGCDRPPSWCDVHHCQHWEDGGETNVDNGALLCRRHHTFIHKMKWKVRVENGRPVVYRDDGTRYVITRWQVA